MSDIQFTNFFRCPQDNTFWQDTWDSMCNDRCPQCDSETEPYASEELDANGNMVDTIAHVAADELAGILLAQQKQESELSNPPITDINAIKPKTAENIAAHGDRLEKGNQYLTDILHGARVMIQRGKGAYRYFTHLSSGTTRWSPPGSNVASDAVIAGATV